MVQRVDYFKLLRQEHGLNSDITVYLPPEQADCTCVNDTNKLSLLNSPVEYCAVCDNKGYVETPVFEVVQGSVVDYASETQGFAGMIEMSGRGEFDHQRYVIHAAKSDCLLPSDNSKLVFEVSKSVVIEDETFEILAIDKSKLLGQVRVHIGRTN